MIADAERLTVSAPGPLPVVGVMGSGRDPHTVRARRVGAWIARAGYHLLTGGGTGVMAAVTEAFVGIEGRPGRAIGILPGSAGGSGAPAPGEAPPGYPNPWVEIAIRTHLDARRPRWHLGLPQPPQRALVRCRDRPARRRRHGERGAACAALRPARRSLSRAPRRRARSARRDRGRAPLRTRAGLRPCGGPYTLRVRASSRWRTAASATALTKTGIARSTSSSDG